MTFTRRCKIQLNISRGSTKIMGIPEWGGVNFAGLFRDIQRGRGVKKKFFPWWGSGYFLKPRIVIFSLPCCECSLLFNFLPPFDTWELEHTNYIFSCSLNIPGHSKITYSSIPLYDHVLTNW